MCQLQQITPTSKSTVSHLLSALFGNNTNHIARYGIADPLNSLDWIAFKPTNSQLSQTKYLLITIYFQKMGRDGNSKYMVVSVTSSAVDRYPVWVTKNCSGGWFELQDNCDRLGGALPTEGDLDSRHSQPCLLLEDASCRMLSLRIPCTPSSTEAHTSSKRFLGSPSLRCQYFSA